MDMRQGVRAKISSAQMAQQAASSVARPGVDQHVTDHVGVGVRWDPAHQPDAGHKLVHGDGL
jgi:hypothetical protein